jgi:hypothetical protein
VPEEGGYEEHLSGLEHTVLAPRTREPGHKHQPLILVLAYISNRRAELIRPPDVLQIKMLDPDLS